MTVLINNIYFSGATVISVIIFSSLFIQFSSGQLHSVGNVLPVQGRMAGDRGMENWQSIVQRIVLNASRTFVGNDEIRDVLKILTVEEEIAGCTRARASRIKIHSQETVT